MAEAFYERGGDGEIVASELTRGPWDPGAQHAGPPAALLGRELERLPGGEGFQIGRVTFEILGSVPIGPLRVSARVARPGRRVEMLEAELGDGERVLMRARAWRIRTSPVQVPAEAMREVPPPGPEQAGAGEFFPTGQERGYHTAMECRFLSGGFLELGPAQAWMRMRVPLLDGEEPTPLQRLLVCADVGNGISAVVDYHRFVFINVDLTVHLERLPEGEWVLVDAVTLAQPNGVGTAESTISDRRGRCGRGLQTLLISER